MEEPADIPTSIDRRLIESADIPAGPPGAEADDTAYQPAHRSGDQSQQQHNQRPHVHGDNVDTTVAAAIANTNTNSPTKSSRDPRAKRPTSRSLSPARNRRGRGRRSSSSSPDRRRGGGGGGGGRDRDRDRERGRYDDRRTGGSRSRRSRSRDRALASRRQGARRDRSLSPLLRFGGGAGGGGGGSRHQRSPERRVSPGRYRSGSSRQRSRSLSASRQSARSIRKGPVSPPPLLPPHAQLQQQPGSLVTLVGGGGMQQQQYNPMPMYHANVLPAQPVHGGGYGNYGPPPPVVSYGQQPPADLYAGVGGGGYGDYGMPPQQGPPPGFNAYASHGMPVDEFQQSVPANSWNAPLPTQQLQQPPLQQLSQPPQSLAPPIVPVETVDDKLNREAAAEQQKRNQRATMRKQREDYRRRSAGLQTELQNLKLQRDDIETSAATSSPTTNSFLKENKRLQLQIENKLATISNVIDMLTGIIGPSESSPSPPPPPPASLEHVANNAAASTSGRGEEPGGRSKRDSRHDDDDDDDDSSPERLKTKALQSLKRNKGERLTDASAGVEPSVPGTYEVKPPTVENPVNFVHYDPEMHWCQTCQVFPKTAKDFLTHLHSKDHQEMQKTIESPWHDHPQNDEMPAYPNAPTKRTPIRGLQFFVPTTGWYCSICAVWMGDLHCASLHLKSKTHARQYHEYVGHNPSFEVDWMSDRQRAYEKKREQAAVAAAAAAGPAVPPPPPSFDMAAESAVAAGIPLQIQVSSHAGKPLSAPIVATAVAANESAEEAAARRKAAKRRRKEERREQKKKKKRSKKHRKQRSSSSSSNSDSATGGSDNDESQQSNAGNDSTAGAGGGGGNASDGAAKGGGGSESSHSIRVAMRNLLRQQSELTALEEIKQKQLMQLQAPSVTGADASAAAAVAAGRWTVVQQSQKQPPVAPMAPTISANGAEANKRDELLIAQWNEPQPLISDREKLLLEELKNKARSKAKKETAAAAMEQAAQVATQAEKKRVATPPPLSPKRGGDRDDRERDSRRRAASRSRSRERSTSGYQRGGGGGGRAARSRSRGRRVSRSRSRGRRGRQSRSRSRDRRGRQSRSRSRDRRRSRSRSRSYGRTDRSRRSRSRSRQRTQRIIEKPIVRYPEFRPRVPEQPEKADGAGGKETTKKVSVVLKKTTLAATSGGAPAKKLPFIGRMPVFKKLSNDEEQQAAAAKLLAEQQQQLQQQHQQQQQQQHADYHHNMQHHSHANMYNHHHQHHQQQHPYDYDDNLMPDPMQFVSMMGAAPPPPPMVPPPPPAAEASEQDELDATAAAAAARDNEPVLPPGIDAADADQVIKPISDAPLPRKGPLPQDFQDALSIIFPGERKPPTAETDGDGDNNVDEEVTATNGSVAAAVTDAGSADGEASIDSSIGDAAAAARQLLEPSPEATISAPPVSAAEMQEEAAAAAAAAAAQRHEEHSQHSMDLFSAFTVVNGVAVLNPELTGAMHAGGDANADHVLHHVMGGDGAGVSTSSMASMFGGSGGDVDAADLASLYGEVPLPPMATDADATMAAELAEDVSAFAGSDSNSRDEAARQEELNDMAMLGIDADDLAAQCML